MKNQQLTLLKGERKTENFPLRSVTRQGDFLTISIQYSTVKPRQNSKNK